MAFARNVIVPFSFGLEYTRKKKKIKIKIKINKKEGNMKPENGA